MRTALGILELHGLDNRSHVVSEKSSLKGSQSLILGIGKGNVNLTFAGRDYPAAHALLLASVLLAQLLGTSDRSVCSLDGLLGD